MQTETIICTSDEVVAREVGGELVLLHLESGTYFGLNAVGGRVWQLLEEGNCSIASLCEVVAGEFDAEQSVVEADLLALAAELEENGLVKRAAAA